MHLRLRTRDTEAVLHRGLSNITTETVDIETTIAILPNRITIPGAAADTSITHVANTNREATEAEAATRVIGAEEVTTVVLGVALKEALGTTNPGVTIRRNASQITSRTLLPKTTPWPVEICLSVTWS